MNILQKNVSYYKNVVDTTGTPIQLYSFLTSAKHAGKVAELRAAVAAGAPDETISALKKALPCCTPSGLFSVRNTEGLIQHTGFIAIDIDKKDNTHLTNFADVKNELSRLKEVAYCGLSCSGRGYFALIRLAYPEKHLAQFEALQNIFTSWGLVIDDVCKDVVRLRLYSYDASAYFNLQAEPFTGVSRCKTNLHQLTPTYTNLHLTPTYTNLPLTDAEKLANLIQWCNATHTDITGNYRAWFEIGAGLAAELGETGRGYFHELSGQYGNYDYLESEKQYNYCLKCKYSYTLATVFHYAKLAGWQGAHLQKVHVSNGKKIELKKELTDAEKLAALIAKNPDMGELCTRLDLHLE